MFITIVQLTYMGHRIIFEYKLNKNCQSTIEPYRYWTKMLKWSKNFNKNLVERAERPHYLFVSENNKAIVLISTRSVNGGVIDVISSNTTV